jgi:hypothetical protein
MQRLHFFWKFENRYWDFGKKVMKRGESISNPSQNIVTNIIFLQFNFLVMYGHHILDYLF